MILPTLGLLLTFLTGLVLVISTQTGILLAIFSKPIIDASWSYNMAGLSASKVVAGLFPLLLLLKPRGSGYEISSMPLYRLWLLYIIYGVLSSTGAIIHKDVIVYADQILRMLNGFVGFYMIQAWFSDKESFKRLVTFFLYASIFPLAVAMYQAVTGTIFQERVAAGFYRYVGFYHDAIVLRHICFQAIISAFLYWSYFVEEKGDFLKKAILGGLVAISFIAIFNLYSKAGFLLIAVWGMIWAVSRGQFMPVIGALFLILAVNFAFYEKIWSVTEQVYWKEYSAISGGKATEGVSEERRNKRTLSGRWYIWERTIDEYLEAPLYTQLFGRGSGGAPHNDYLYRLVANGLIGLISYVTLLIAIGVRVFKNYLRNKAPIHVAAMLLFSLWMIDSVGLVPSAYISYQWYVWGLIGLSFKGFDKDPKTLIEKVESEP